MKTKTIAVDFLDGRWPTEYVTVPESMPTHLVIERMQRNYRALGHRDGVKFQVTDGRFVDAVTSNAARIGCAS